MENLPKAQAAKDATMAHFIMRNWSAGKTMFHLNGSYHSSNFEGIVWHLKQQNKDLKIITIEQVIQPEIHTLSEENLKKKHNKWEQKCGLLSMGQQQRVAIIRAMAQPFKWLIMDEPFSHLDVDNTNRCLKIIHERTTELGAGFVLTTLGDFHNYNYDQELKL